MHIKIDQETSQNNFTKNENLQTFPTLNQNYIEKTQNINFHIENNEFFSKNYSQKNIYVSDTGGNININDNFGNENFNTLPEKCTDDQITDQNCSKITPQNNITSNIS